MTGHRLSIICFWTVFWSCNSSTTRQETYYVPSDTTTSFKIDGFWITPKKSFDFNSLGKSESDTLHLVTCSQYVYFPFGKLTDRQSLKSSNLKSFTIKKFKRDTFTNLEVSSDLLWRELMDLQLGDNKLCLVLDNDPEASMHGYIQGGQIVDDKVTLCEDIRIGMNIEEFYNVFFSHFPIELQKKYKVLKFESCVTDIVHIYTFDNGQLNVINFVSP